MQYISKLVEKHPEPKSDWEIWPVKGFDGWKKIVMRLDVLGKKSWMKLSSSRVYGGLTLRFKEWMSQHQTELKKNRWLTIQMFEVLFHW